MKRSGEGDSMPEEKKGIRIPQNILTIILAILAVVATIFGWGMKLMSIQKDLESMQARVVVIEAERPEYVETLHKIELHLAGMDQKMKAFEKFVENHK